MTNYPRFSVLVRSLGPHIHMQHQHTSTSTCQHAWVFCMSWCVDLECSVTQAQELEQDGVIKLNRNRDTLEVRPMPSCPCATHSLLPH